jgi:acetylornithine deacetylase
MSAEQKVHAWIGEHHHRVVEFLQELIRVPSVTTYFDEDPKLMREGDAQRLLKRRLEDMGFETELTYPDAKKLAKYAGMAGYYPDYTFEDRPNLYGAYRGSGGGRSLLLAGHIDVVPRGSQWTTDPFGAVIKDGRLYGRGAVDMKGGIAAMIMAFHAIKECGITLKGDVKVGAVVGEEAGGMGTLAFVDAGYRADGCLITEPTHLNVAPLCRGILWGKIVIPGRSGHIELKQGDWRDGGAVDAIDKGRLYLDMIDRLNKKWAVAKEHKYLPIPCQINVAQFNAGEYPTTFANRAEITFDAQYLPAEKDQMGLGGRVKAEIEAFVADVAQTDDWLRENPPRVEWIVDADCGETADTEPFFQMVRDTTLGLESASRVEGICCHTDMGWYCNVGIPTINLGPGDPRYAHQADEFVEISELIRCAQIIASIILNWCEET